MGAGSAPFSPVHSALTCSLDEGLSSAGTSGTRGVRGGGRNGKVTDIKRLQRSREQHAAPGSTELVPAGEWMTTETDCL